MDRGGYWEFGRAPQNMAGMRAWWLDLSASSLSAEPRVAPLRFYPSTEFSRFPLPQKRCRYGAAGGPARKIVGSLGEPPSPIGIRRS